MVRYKNWNWVIHKPKVERLFQWSAQVDTDVWGVSLMFNRYPYEIRPFGEYKGGWRLDLHVLCLWLGVQYTCWRYPPNLVPPV